MAKKRALVVDDSKSARFVLKRMLTELQLNVDVVESAQEGINYLELNRPDIIFMDHMMPGMDGMEATKRIKANPLTSAIPIMMYTSKGGDVYLSQLKALGIIGIVPKTIAQTELQDSLLAVGLIDRATIDQAELEKTVKVKKRPVVAERKAAAANKVAATVGAGAGAAGVVDKSESENEGVLTISVDELRKMLDDQTIELHKSMWLGIESVSNEIFNRLNVELEDRLDQLEASVESVQSTEHESVEKPGVMAPRSAGKLDPRIPVFVISALLLMSFIFNFILMNDNNDLKDKVEQRDSQPATIQQSPEFSDNGLSSQADQVEIWNFIQWATKQTTEYPYDELALNERRLSFIENIISRAVEANYKGRIILQTHVGEFCLKSDSLGRYKLAKGSLPVTRCDTIGNNMQPNDQASSHQSVAFINYLEDSSLLNESGIIIEVTNLPRSSVLSKYPSRKASTKAEEWNKAAQRNNRVSIKLDPGYFGM